MTPAHWMKIKREYSIALLVLGGVVLLIFGVNFLKGLDLFQKRNVYHAVYNDVTGVTGATPVYYNGFKVGQVISRELMPDASGHIVVSFQIDEDQLVIPEDTKVEIYSADLFSRALQLLLGSSSTPAAEGDTLLGDSQLSLTDAVSGEIDPLKRKAESMIANVDSILTVLQKILNDSAQGDIDASFASIRGTLESFNSTAHRIDALIAAESATIQATLENVKQVTANLVAYNENIARILQNADTVTSTLANGELKKMMADLNTSSAQLKEVMRRLNEGEGSLGALLTNDTLYTNLESASKELDMLIEDLRLNPNRYVHLSLFGKKDKLPKLSESDIDRIQRAMREEAKP